MWDVAAEKQAFKAKPPPLDWVGMYKKIFITALSFLPGEGPQRAAAGDDRCVRVFDFRAQRRAVQTIEFGETLVKAVAVAPGARARPRLPRLRAVASAPLLAPARFYASERVSLRSFVPPAALWRQTRRPWSPRTRTASWRRSTCATGA